MPSQQQQDEQESLRRAIHKERERSVQLHLVLLSHAARCKEDKCPSANCARMKVLLRHEQACKVRAKGGCGACKRIWALLHIHARTCGNASTSPCHVPHCQQVRQRHLRLQQQQVAPSSAALQEGTAPLEVVKI